MSDQLIRNIRKSIRGLNQSYGVFDEKTWTRFGITYALSQVLFAIKEAEAPVAKALSETLRIDKSTTSRFLARLHKQKLIAYGEVPEDGRSKRVALTREGKALLMQLDQFGDQKTREALKGMNAQEIRDVEAALAKLERGLRKGSSL